MKVELILQNVSCEACANTILDKARSTDGISNPKIELIKNSLTIDCISHNALMGLKMGLKEIGYPVINECHIVLKT